MSNKMPASSNEKTASEPSPRSNPLGPLWIKVLLVLGALAMVITATFLAWPKRQQLAMQCQTDPVLDTVTLQIGGRQFTAEVARSGQEQVRGLSGRDCLGEDRAMLFPYARAGDYCFWMKDMEFSIDMVWLDDEKNIVTIKDKVSPDTYPQSFCPDRPAQFVVELPAGTAGKLQLDVGQPIAF